MAKCCAWSHLWGPTFNEKYLYLIDHVRELGFDGFEIPLNTEILNDLPKKRMKEKSAEKGINITFCAGLNEN